MSSKRAARKRSQTTVEQPLTVTVLVSPLRRFGKDDLRRELRLVRSALLYADRVELVSTTSALLNTFEPLRRVSHKDPWDDIRRLPDEALARIFEGRSVKSVRKRLARLTQLPSYDPERSQIEATHLPEIQEALRKADALYNSAMAPELDLARDRGLVVLRDAGFVLEQRAREHTRWFDEKVAEHLKNADSTLLFDQRARRTAKRLDGADETWVTVKDRSKRATVGSGLVRELPTFPDASMADVLRVRDALTDERRSYRGAVRGLSASLTSQAFDEPLDSEISEYWNDVLEPSLNNLTLGVTTSELARRTGRRLFGDVGARLKVGGFLSFGVASFGSLESTLR